MMVTSERLLTCYGAVLSVSWRQTVLWLSSFTFIVCFQICDQDNDQILNDKEIYRFQVSTWAEYTAVVINHDYMET